MGFCECIPLPVPRIGSYVPKDSVYSVYSSILVLALCDSGSALYVMKPSPKPSGPSHILAACTIEVVSMVRLYLTQEIELAGILQIQKSVVCRHPISTKDCYRVLVSLTLFRPSFLRNFMSPFVSSRSTIKPRE